MAIRIPTQAVLDYNDVGNVGAGSVAGGVAVTFNMPQDSNNVAIFLTASVVGGGVSATLQTSPDGGTTFYDVARSSVVSNANATTGEWITASTIPNTQALGSAAASSLGVGAESGLPILGMHNRVFLRYTAAVTANALSRVQVFVNEQSSSAN